MRRLIISLLGAFMLLGLISAPAQADERPCVSRAEYRNMAFSWWPPATRAKVNDHFDFQGRVDFATGGWGDRDVWVDYRKCLRALAW